MIIIYTFQTLAAESGVIMQVLLDNMTDRVATPTELTGVIIKGPNSPYKKGQM